MAARERRKEPRYVVDAVNLILGGEVYPVIDLSPTSARVSCPVKEYERLKTAPAQLEFNLEGEKERYEIEPALIRTTELYVVVGYAPPRPGWGAFIRQFDTFRVDELDEQLFD